MKVILENNQDYKERCGVKHNHQKFDLYTDEEIGIEGDLFDENLVRAVSVQV